MKRIILASKSPRRIEMMKKYIHNLEIFSPDTEEIVNEEDLPQTTVMKLSFEKAANVSLQLTEHGLIIAADTIVFLDKIMGKPASYEEGFEMLKLLSGKTHKVFTGICIIDSLSGKKVVDYEETLVKFKHLTDDFIKRYLDTGEYKDKAGAYGIQGYGELLVESINGCYNNVKGLPVAKLNDLLTKHFSCNLL